ncbi:MAG: 4Fe-4S binding protein [Lentisphaerae bacterium]|nr:4Fe-4S binding protein [Lentisphaerota bacterium]
MLRDIIQIDEAACTGCGDCVTSCPEGAIQVIDGKARLISDLMCDGLGACIGHCPEGAITIERREAEPYDERRVMVNIVKAGTNTIRAHLRHLREHNESDYLRQALDYLREHNIPEPGEEPVAPAHGGCPGARQQSFARETAAAGQLAGSRPSQLQQWPIQMHLLSPTAPHFQGSDLLLAADCVAFSLGDFHQDYLAGKTLAIACPKLDEGQEAYVAKLRSLIDDARINTLTVMIMQVPCCRGLLRLAQLAAEQATRKVPIKVIVVGLKGEILQDEWL